MKPQAIVYKPKNKKPKEEDVFSLKNLYEKACAEYRSDIFMHLPVLYEYAKGCDHVTEMGARGGNSTRAFLYANPKKFISYDYQYTSPEPHLVSEIQSLIGIFNKAKEEGVDCECVGADVLKIEIQETDLLFIDTWHCYSQLKKELELHSSKVRKYIAFHDTFTYGQQGEGYPKLDVNHPNRDLMNGDGGIRRAIDEFLEENSDWSICYETEENNGLIIIEKNSNESI
jgi:hypothetical protein